MKKSIFFLILCISLGESFSAYDDDDDSIDFRSQAGYTLREIVGNDCASSESDKNRILYGFYLGDEDRKNQSNLIKELFNKKYTELEDKDKNQALLIGISNNNSDLCSFLLNSHYKIDVNACLEPEYGPKTFLGYAKSVEIAQLLVTAGASVCDNHDLLFYHPGFCTPENYEALLLFYYARGARFIAKDKVTIVHDVLHRAAHVLHDDMAVQAGRTFTESITPEIMYHMLMQRPDFFKSRTALEEADTIISSHKGQLFPRMDGRGSYRWRGAGVAKLREIYKENISCLGIKNNFSGNDNDCLDDIYHKDYALDNILDENNHVIWDKKTALSLVFPESRWQEQHEAIKIFFSLVDKNGDPVLSLHEKYKALMVAVAHSNKALCDLILKPVQDTSINVNYRLSADPVHPTVLSRVRDVNLAEKFITQYKARVAGDKRLLFNAVLRTNNVELVRLYANKGASLINQDGETIFHTLALADCAEQKPLAEMAQAIWDTRPDECRKVIQYLYACYSSYGTALEWAQKIAQHLPKDHPRALYRDFLEQKAREGSLS